MARILTERWKIEFVSCVYMLFTGGTRRRQKASTTYGSFEGCGVDAREPSGHVVSRVYIKMRFNFGILG